jgi:hypothetical protein
MARGAPTRALEVLFARFRISGLQIGGIHAFAPAFFPKSGVELLSMDKGHEAGNLCFRKIEVRHALIGAANAHYGTDLIPAHIFDDEPRTGEIGSGLSAAGIAAVAKRTILPEQCASTLDQRWRIGTGRDSAGFLDRTSGLRVVRWSLRRGEAQKHEAHQQRSRREHTPMQN